MTVFPSMLQVSSPRPSHTSGLDSMFRPFNMHGMDNVSILFADIVGFTRMSSNKVLNKFQLFSSTFNVEEYCKMYINKVKHIQIDFILIFLRLA